MSVTNRYGSRDASWITMRHRAQIRAASGLQGIQTTRMGPSGSYVSPSSNRIDSSLAGLLPPTTVPDAPTGLSVTAGNSQLTVSFIAGGNGGRPITNYKYSTDNGVTFTAFSPVVTSSPMTITGLTNGTTYQIILLAVNANGDGAPSAVVSGTPATVPAAPTGLAVTPGDQELSISFTAGPNGGRAITNYKYSINSGPYTAFSPADISSPVVITGLMNGTAYQVRLCAVNIIGDGTPSASVSGTPVSPDVGSAPEPPTELSGVAGNEAIYVLFTAGADGGSAITNYEYSIDGGANFTAFNPAQSTSPVEISGLELINGTPYTVLLKAVNNVGASDASSSITVTPAATSLLSTGRLINMDMSDSNSYSGSGTSLMNLDSGGLYSATLLGSTVPSYTNTGVKYLTFNGTDQVASIAAAAAINPTTPFGSFTIQIWARVDTASPNFFSGDGLITKQRGSVGDYDGYSLSLNKSTGQAILNMNGASINGNYVSTASNVYSNGWALYTIVVRFGGGVGNPSQAYVSTRQVVSRGNTESGMPNSTAPLQFPRGIQDTSSNFCPADVAAFYMYNTTLTHAQIIQNYDATKSRFSL
jgi:hypothetical protein